MKRRVSLVPSVPFVAAAVLALGVAACGGGKPPPAPAAPDPVAEAPREPQKPGLVMQQELGSIDPGEAEKAFQKAQPEIMKCHKKGTKRVDVLSGDVKFFLRLDGQGKPKWLYFEESTLGDHELETCLLEAIAKAPWPAPVGGEGEVRKGFGFDLGDVRPPTPWEPEKPFTAANESKDVKKCLGGGASDGKIVVTMYVQPHGKHGKVEAVGYTFPASVAKDAKASAEKAECLGEALKGLKLPSPGSYVAKVTFQL